MLLGHRHFVTVFSKDGAPDLDSFAWQVLDTLATAADVSTDDAGFSVTITMQPEDVGAGL